MDIQQDLAYLDAALPQLEAYLLSAELYYPLGGNLPRLTLGGLLLAMQRTDTRVEALRARAQAEALQARWLSAWKAKSAREIKARAFSWTEYLSEVMKDRAASARLYAVDVRYRAMLSLLGSSAHEGDAFLRSIFHEGHFVWEAEVAPNFSREKFWYLFGNIKE